MKNSSKVGGGAQGAAAKDNIDVMVFENAEFGPVRTLVDDNGDPLFCGKDVCDALGYKKSYEAIKQHVSHADTVKCGIGIKAKNQYGESSKTTKVQMVFVNESGVYSLVFGSKLESAQRFKHWVTSEVLPAIRKNGGYFHINPGETIEHIKARFQKVLDEAIAERDEKIRQKDELLKHGKEVAEQNKKLIAEQVARIHELDKTVGDQMVRLQKSAEEILSQEAYIDRLLPKSLYTDNVLDSISCYTTTQVAKELGCTAQELNRSLCACHVQYYQSGQYLLYADYAHMGLAKSRTHYKAVMEPRAMTPGEKVGRVYTHTYLVWTERGRKFIHDLAKRLWDLAEYEQLKSKFIERHSKHKVVC